MDRRQALTWAGTIATVALLPEWLSCAPSMPENAATSVHDPLGSALAAAARNGKPVLVFVAPSQKEARDRLAHVIAEALDVGGDDLFVDLALCEVACATQEQLLAVLGTSVTFGSAGVVEIDNAAARWIACDFSVTSDALDADTRRDMAWRNISAIQFVLAADERMLARRAAAARRALGAEFVSTLNSRLKELGALTVEELDRGAALVRVHEWAIDATAQLASAARIRIWEHAPHGARWSILGGGCGSYPSVVFLDRDSQAQRREILDRALGPVAAPLFPYTSSTSPSTPFHRAPQQSPPMMPACGLGSLPYASRRFLVFYTDEK